MSVRAQSADGVFHEFPDGTNPAVIDRAMKGYAATPYAKARTEAMGTERGQNSIDRSLQHQQTFGFDDELAGTGAALRTVVGNTINRVRGKPVPYGVADAYRATADARRDLNSAFSREHPIQELALGAVAAPVKAEATVVDGLLKTAAKGGLFGGAFGALSGAGNAQSAPGASLPRAALDRAAGAGRGAVMGAALGAATPLAIAGGAKAVRATGQGARTVVRATNRASGGKMLDPSKEVGRRLAEQLQKDGLGPAEIQAAAAEWQRNGATPAFMDVAGENTRALIRAAGTQGPARQAAVKYADRTAADLQDKAIDLTKGLTPQEARPAGAVRQEIEDMRGVQASTDYAEPYSQKINVTPDLASALRGREGEAAIKRALAAAEARRDPQQVAELRVLQKAISGGVPAQRRVSPYYTRATTEPPLPPVSGATLDRLQIAMRDRAEQLSRAGSRDIAGGVQGRRAALNDGLDAFEGLAEARRAYRSSIGQEEAIALGETGLRARPDEFAADLDALRSRTALPEHGVGIGYRQSLTDAIGAPTEGAVGALNRISSSTNQGRNLATAFGDEAAGQYQAGVGNLVDQVNNARFINPNANSKTAGVLGDESLVSMPKMRPVDMLMSLLDKVKRGATLTDAEREMIVSLGTGAPSPALKSLPPQKAPGPRLSPFFFPAVGEIAGR